MSRGREVLAALDLAAEAAAQVEWRLDEPLCRHTTNRLGGPADLLARPRTVEALSALLAAADAAGTPVTFLGGGTNLLVRDGGIRGLVIQLKNLRAVVRPDPDRPTQIRAEAGASTGRVLARARAWGLGGVEFLAGVPGTVGGGVIMNAGTFLGEFRNVVRTVTSLSLRGETRVRSCEACGFGYRTSALPATEVVVAVDLALHPRPPAEIDRDVARLRAHRRAREPQGVPNNGSTFKNPPGDYAGRLIEAAGLKGVRVGGAVVSPVHANWLVVDRNADPPCTAADMLALMERVEREVEARFGVRLEREVRVVGDPP